MKMAKDASLFLQTREIGIGTLNASDTMLQCEDSCAGMELLPSNLRIESSEIEVLDLIGSGGAAEVFKCRWQHRDYAVKIFRAGDVASLRKEVENLIPLRHTNIVLLVGFSIRESDSRPMVVMELLDYDLHTLIIQRNLNQKKLPGFHGVTEFQMDPNGPIPMRIAIDFICQIATGMAYLHKKKLLHGDLKSLNVLIKCHHNRYELKISDFDVSQKLILKPGAAGYGSDYDNTSFGNANVGTTRWRAPEVFDLKPYSMKADVYSFAMTCVEILTRQVPYSTIAIGDVREYVRAGGRPELPATVLKDLRKLIVRCWDMDPTRRPDFFEICKDMQGLKNSRCLDVEERRESGYFSKFLLWCRKQ